MDEDADSGEDVGPDSVEDAGPDSVEDADPDSDEHADPSDDADPNEDVDQHGDADPRAIRSLAVTSGDVVAAYEARRRSSRRPVLRATPPFSGRMRARLHDSGSSSASERAEVSLDLDTGALHVPPGRLLDEDAIPSYPDPDETEDELREDPEIEFSVETHRERHVEAVESWRAAVEDAIVETVEMGLPEGSHVVEVKTLSDSSEG